MANIVTMQRYEFKYVVTKDQIAALEEKLKGHMVVDEYGKTSIASLYYDTPDHRLIRTSIEKPPFKEKIRLRSYGVAKPNSKVFLELKRKTERIVYKRRIVTTQEEAKRFFSGEEGVFSDNQIAREIQYFKNYYGTLIPYCLIIYDRVAYKETGGDLRLTIDGDPRFRMDRLDLGLDMQGTLLLPEEGWAILEIKVQNAVPLWLARILSDLKIYKTSFSKYGEAFKRIMTSNTK